MHAVVARPVEDGALVRDAVHEHEQAAQRRPGRVGAVGPEAVDARRDAQARDGPQHVGPQQRVRVDRREAREAQHGPVVAEPDVDDHGPVQRAAVVVPLDRLVPVRGVQVQGPRRHLLVRVRRAQLRRRFRGRGGLGGARRDDGGGRRHDFTARGRLSDGFCWLTAWTAENEPLARRASLFLALAPQRDLLVVSALLPRVRLCDSKTGAADRKTRRLLAWLLLQTVSGPLALSTEFSGRREDFSGRCFTLGLENRGKDRRAVSPPRGAAH